MSEKSYVQYALGLYKAMLVDIVESRPSLRMDCERDFKRLLSLVEHEGLRAFTLTLPACAKHLDRCVAQGLFTASGLPYQRPFSNRGPIPRLFKGLYLRVFDDSGKLRVDSDPQALADLRRLLLVAKKAQFQCPPSATWRQVDEFFRIDLECRQDSLGWKFDVIDTSGIGNLTLCDYATTMLPGDSLFGETTSSNEPTVGAAEFDTIQRVADLVVASIGRFEPSEWRAKHGPGAVSDLVKGASKYDFPHWPDKLENVFPFADYGVANHQLAVVHSLRNGDSGKFRHEPPAKLIAVPKTLDKPRLIASEPIAHQWCQQIILSYFSGRIKKSVLRHSVNLRSQEANRGLALLSSHDQRCATIDLSSASDRVSCSLVERIFRRNPSLVEAFHAARTRYIRNELDRKSPRYHILRKFSTMGSAVTFPVQSVIFAIAAISAIIIDNGLRVNNSAVEHCARQVRVYGDDIIVPITSSPRLLDILVALGFKANFDKTFTTGKFRESCGIEAYDGHDVSRISLPTSPDVARPESIVSCVDVHNTFYERGYWATAQYIKSTLSKITGIVIPDKAVGSGELGFLNFEPSFDRLRSRWNEALHRLEYSVTGTLSRSVRTETEFDLMLLQYFTEACRPPDRNETRLGTASRPSVKLRRRWVSRDSLISEGFSRA